MGDLDKGQSIYDYEETGMPFKGILLGLAIVAVAAALTLAGVASAKPAPYPKFTYAVPVAWVAGFKKGYGRPLGCAPAQKRHIIFCYDGRYEFWVMLFRPSKCVMAARMTPDTGNLARDNRALMVNPTSRRSARIC